MKNYPIIDEHRKHYVHFPMQITEHMVSKVLTEVKVGNWMAVNVVKGGYEYLVAPADFKTKQACQKGCDVHNKFHGWTPKKVKEIISWSMGLLKKSAPKPYKPALPHKLKTVIKSQYSNKCIGVIRAKNSFPSLGLNVKPNDLVVCRWIEYSDGKKTHTEAKETIAICRHMKDSFDIYRTHARKLQPTTNRSPRHIKAHFPYTKVQS